MTSTLSIPGLSVLRAGEGWVAVDKAAGMLSVPGRGPEKVDSVLTRVRAVFPEAEAPHRLDMDTSGVLVVATSLDAMRYISRGFERRKQDKVYIAIVEGELSDAQGVIEVPIEKDWENRPSMRVADSGKPSATTYEVLAYDPVTGRSRVRLEPRTGRTHQLRVHMAHIGHPIVGDPLYGSESARSEARLYLHALRLSFAQPGDGHRIVVEAPIPF